MRLKFSRSTLKKLSVFLGKETLRMARVSVLCGLVLFVTEFAFAIAMQSLLSSLGMPVATGMPSFVGALLSRQLGFALLLIALIVSIRSFFQWIQATAQQSVALELTNSLRQRILKWGFSSPVLKVSEIYPLFGDKSVFAGLVVLHFQQIILNALIALLIAGTLFWLSPIPTAIAMASLLALTLPFASFSKRVQAAGTLVNDEKSGLDRRFLRSLRVLLFLKIYSKENEERESINDSLNRILNMYKAHYRLAGFSANIPQVLGIFVMCAVIFLIRRFEQERESSIIIPYLYLFFRFTQNASIIVSNYGSLLFYLPSFMDMAQWWAKHSHDRLNAPASENAELDFPFDLRTRIGWELKDVKFRYPEGDRDTLCDVSLVLHAGSTVAVIGPSGAGKSTLISVLLAQLTPQHGTVHILGPMDKRYELSMYRGDFLKRVGYVGAEPFLFEGTVRENLAYGLSSPPTEALLQRALADAECHFLSLMPLGMEHFLSDQGQGLSAGQKQRLSLARALLREPSVLVLDEATSNLDLKTEAAIIETLRGLKKNLTMVVVTHRATMLTLADQVFSVNGGVLQEGVAPVSPS